MKSFFRFIIISFVILGILNHYDIILSIKELMIIGLLVGTIDAFISFFFGGNNE